MKHVLNYAAYPTQGIKTSRADFAQYVKGHINYLLAANQPEYGTITDETTALYDDMFGAVSAHEQFFNKRVSLTQNVNAIKKEFNARIDELEEVFVFKFHKNSPVYNEVFPHGVTPYKVATLSETPIKMELAEQLANKYKTTIGDTYLVSLQEVRARYEAETNAQGMAKGEVKNIIPDYKVKRLAVDKQLLKNICTIILHNLDNPTVVESFFDEHLIFPKNKKKEETDEPYSVIVAPNTHIAANMTFSIGDTLLVTNTGSVSLFYYGAAAADAAIPTSLAEILPDEETEITAAELGAPANKYLILVNRHSTDEGEAEIMLL